MFRRILSPNREELLARERQRITELAAALAAFDAARDDLATLESSARQLDELFLLVVAGEFNAGKSAFINALLGEKILEEGPTPTTTRVHVLGYGPTVTRSAERQGAATSPPSTDSAIDVITAPVELLREIRIVDTPGTNAIHREHEMVTREFVPRSDLVLFVTSADRPFTESERGFLSAIREWGKKILLVVNKIDILETTTDIQKVVGFVREAARDLLGETPEVFPLSAKRALRAKESGDDDALAESGFQALETYVAETLDARERMRLKLGNPLGVARHLTHKYLAVIDGRVELLAQDVAAIANVERQLAVYREDMAREFRFRLADVDKVLHEMENRGVQFFDETLRLGRVFDLLNKEKIRAAFEQTVVADLPQAIDRRVHEVIDWMVGADLRQWQAVIDHIGERRHQQADHIVGAIGGNFHLDRTRLLESVGREAQRSVESYDARAEAERMADSVKQAVAGTALVEVGALGLGAALVHVAATAAADFTGIVAAGTIAALGLFILPSRREKAKRELRAKIQALRERLMAALTAQFDREIERSIHKIEEGIAPYTRFVRSERGHLDQSRAALATLDDAFQRLQADVDRL